MSFIKGLDRQPLSTSYGTLTSNRLLNQVIVAIVVVLVLAHVCRLKHIPGPWITRIMTLKPLSLQPIHGKTLLKLHQKYGDRIYKVADD